MNLFSFKKIVACFGLLTIASSPTIMVVSTVNDTENKGGSKEIPKNDPNSELVVRAINSTVYRKAFFIYSVNANGLYADMCANYIKVHLPNNIQNIFIDELFSVNKIFNECGTELKDSDLQRIGEFCFTLNYNYGAIKNQVTTLTVKIAP